MKKHIILLLRSNLQLFLWWDIHSLWLLFIVNKNTDCKNVCMVYMGDGMRYQRNVELYHSDTYKFFVMLLRYYYISSSLKVAFFFPLFLFHANSVLFKFSPLFYSTFTIINIMFFSRLFFLLKSVTRFSFFFSFCLFSVFLYIFLLGICLK